MTPAFQRAASGLFVPADAAAPRRSGKPKAKKARSLLLAADGRPAGNAKRPPIRSQRELRAQDGRRSRILSLDGSLASDRPRTRLFVRRGPYIIRHYKPSLHATGSGGGGGGGAPSPSICSNIYWDTRAGGGQDITAATTMAQANAAAPYNPFTIPFGFCSDYEYNASGRAHFLTWKGNQVNSNGLEVAGLNFTGKMYVQFKTRWGRTPASTNVSGSPAQIGSVGVYEQQAPIGSGNGHKQNVRYRKTLSGSTTNMQRITNVWGKDTGPILRGFFTEIDAMPLAIGTANAGSATTLDRDLSTSAWTVNGFAGDIVVLDGGSGSDATFITIVSNTANQLTVAAWHGGSPDNTTHYRVMQAVTQEFFQDDGTVNSAPAVATDLNLYNNQEVVITELQEAETAPLSGDGRYRRWLNDTLVMDIQNYHSGELPWGNDQEGGPTWNAGPVQDQMQYLYDHVVGKAA